MIGVKNVIFENNNTSLVINVGNKCYLYYNGITNSIDNKKMFNYLISLHRIIDNWEKEYINTTVIDGSSWKLSIIYTDGNKIEYRGRSNYPTNFEALERLNQELINEV